MCEFTGDGQQVLVQGAGDPFTITQREGDTWLRTGEAVHAVIPAARLHHFDSNGKRRNARSTAR
jgi:hypothetical protein